MAMPNAQPTLPAEAEYTDIEQVFIEEEPRGILPKNQNSNYGTVRRVISDEISMAVGQLTELFSEMFISTTTNYVGLWEDQLGVARGDNKTLTSRRVILKSRRARGPFTRARRVKIVESFIIDTFGDPITFSADGIPLTGAGVPLHSEAAPVTALYSITENIGGFSYTVNVVPTVDPDMIGMQRELERITPDGITLIITRNP